MPVLSSQQQEAQLDTAFNFNSTVHGGDLLVSESCSYRVQSFLGQGTFGTVAKYVRINDMKSVAIKMMNTDDNYVQAELEVAALKRLQSLNPDRCNIVRWYEDFVDQGHLCLVFEHLDTSLFDYMKERQFHPLPLKHIRPIVHQLANALHHLKAAKIIHADLKLENVMLVNQQQEPFRVKVIDFGLSAPESGHAVGSYVQSRPYRSPEVILGLTLSWTIDMWSLGCIAAFLYLGHLLYFGNSEYDVIRNITQVQGQPPDRLLSAGCKTDCFFQRNGNYLWKLKTPEQFQRETGITATKPMSNFSSLNDLLHTRLLSSHRGTDRYPEKKDVCMFVDMLKEMLQLDVAKRITPLQLMQHQFTSLGHITHLYPYSHYVRSSVQVMNACQIRKCGKAVRASRRQCTALKSQQHS
uniref:homeodomain-interacting protein kinase 1-like n=1 Tax=Solea senegalensis TaxID=28829 RepID=UPI001CD8D993|nr:homeodomain-interacting protein kinase 1-like [Solea senegalensis]